MPDPNDSAKSAGLGQALDMAVHSMPDPHQALMQNGVFTDTFADGTAARKTGRWKMVLVLLVCAAPVIASYLAYYGFRPEGRRNFGELITPQRPLPDEMASDLDGKPFNLRGLKGQWLLVAVGSGACAQACQHQLYLQRQLRESLGKDKDRLDWVWLVDDDKPIDASLRQHIAGATVLRVAPALLGNWLQAAQGNGLAEHLYVVDPQGNWMMRFPKALDLPAAAKAKRDMERLMRASAFWDQPGR